MQVTTPFDEITADLPCFGHCTTVLGDDVRSGCLGIFDEVNRWLEMSEEERRAVSWRIFNLRTTGFRLSPE